MLCANEEVVCLMIQSVIPLLKFLQELYSSAIISVLLINGEHIQWWCMLLYKSNSLHSKDCTWLFKIKCMAQKGSLETRG